jgi:hypothetical protein
VFIIDFLALDGDVRRLTASVVLLVIMGICFVTAGSIARKIRREAAKTGL